MYLTPVSALLEVKKKVPTILTEALRNLSEVPDKRTPTSELSRSAKGSRATAYLDSVHSDFAKRRIPLSKGLYGRRTTFAYRVHDCISGVPLCGEEHELNVRSTRGTGVTPPGNIR
jgi:hypothetical protein